MRLRTFSYKWLVAVAYVFGLFMTVMDSTIVNVALPTLARSFHARDTTLEWVVTAYLLSLAVWVPASGWVGDRFGTKRTFLFALAMFTTGSLLCSFSWSIGSLIIFRVLQGVGGGMLTPVGASMLYRAFPPHERAAAAAVIIVPTAIAPAIGPLLGGWLIDAFNWHWIFYVNVPVGIIGFLFTFALIQEHREETVGHFDLPGFVLAASGLPLLLFALSQAPTIGWGSTEVIGTGLGGLALLIALVVVEVRVREPMLALRLFRDRMYRNANLVMLAVVAGMIGMLFLLPLYLQQLRGLSAFQSGSATFPGAIGMVLVAQVASRFYPKIGPRRMVASGMATMACVTLCFFWVSLDTSLWWIRALMFMRGMAIGFAMVPIQAAAYSTISNADTGRGTALFSTNRQVAGSIGVAVLATVLVDRTQAYVAAAMHHATTPAAAHAAQLQAGLDGYHDAFLAAAILIAVGALIALLINDKDAEASMRNMEPTPQPEAPLEPAQAPDLVGTRHDARIAPAPVRDHGLLGNSEAGSTRLSRRLPNKGRVLTPPTPGFAQRVLAVSWHTHAQPPRWQWPSDRMRYFLVWNVSIRTG